MEFKSKNWTVLCPFYLHKAGGGGGCTLHHKGPPFTSCTRLPHHPGWSRSQDHLFHTLDVGEKPIISSSLSRTSFSTKTTHGPLGQPASCSRGKNALLHLSVHTKLCARVVTQIQKRSLAFERKKYLAQKQIQRKGGKKGNKEWELGGG